ncbi:hypothetical protein Fleli_2015 [Bernardetia litoralis DSM 6794]|uniref:Uncharacterized protein n=1 Tax=Bernardetia litoralis (strain ATCC 23117 / DSM 6794 / NBRC 15988 / NCIMB 1366 / Fx l1 / Sio-4) TaxID=880071 RepID=I4AKB4_BERLS|nr:hypothetical protein [Bernardetia litoralis]AFM04399.1 hypothetical protein Fleli_2015 [Bernardetia litoralis DSM 6794]
MKDKNIFSSHFSKVFFVFFVVMIFTFTFGIIDADAQCAMCRATVETNYSNGDGGASTRLNSGILYLLCMPYLLIGTVAFFWYRKKQKNQRNGKRTFKISSNPAM